MDTFYFKQIERTQSLIVRTGAFRTEHWTDNERNKRLIYTAIVLC